MTSQVDTARGLLASTIGNSSLDHSPREGSSNYPLEGAGFEAIADARFTLPTGLEEAESK